MHRCKWTGGRMNSAASAMIMIEVSPNPVLLPLGFLLPEHQPHWRERARTTLMWYVVLFGSPCWIIGERWCSLCFPWDLEADFVLLRSRAVVPCHLSSKADCEQECLLDYSPLGFVLVQSRSCISLLRISQSWLSNNRLQHTSLVLSSLNRLPHIFQAVTPKITQDHHAPFCTYRPLHHRK